MSTFSLACLWQRYHDCACLPSCDWLLHDWTLRHCNLSFRTDDYTALTSFFVSVPEIMVWMRVRKTRSAFLNEAVMGGYNEKDAVWWWHRMYSEAIQCRNGTAEGSDGGTEDGDVIWIAQTPITWEPALEHDAVTIEISPERFNSVGKILSYLCRHGAEKEGYSMDNVGGILVSDMLWYHSQLRNMKITPEEIKQVVDEVHVHLLERKARFAYYNDQDGRLRVRAHQGHSATLGRNIDDQHVLTKVVSSSNIICCHGTYQRHWIRIQVEGLKIQRRKHVHFSDHMLTPHEGDKEIAILLDVRKWLRDGGVLFRSDNGMFLTEGFEGTVPPCYFYEVRQLRPTEKLVWSCDTTVKRTRRW